MPIDDYDPGQEPGAFRPTSQKEASDFYTSLGAKAGDLWPARVVRDMWGGFMYPGDAFYGKVDPNSEEGLARALGLAGMIVTGGMGRAAFGGAVREVPKAGMLTEGAQGVPYARAAQAAARTAEEGLPGRGDLSGSPGQLAASGGQDQTLGRVNAPALEGLPTRIKIPGHGEIQAGPDLRVRQAAEDYMAEAGHPYHPPRDYVKADPERAKRIADAFDAMAHDPAHPDVQAAYAAMAKETMAQWKHAKAAGLKVDFIPHGGPDPYAASPRLALEDIRHNNHMWVYPTDSGFGTSAITAAEEAANPLLAPSGETISGKPARINDIFRVVHDYFGHAKEGVGFRADGEENAWRSHASMYTPLARKAMTSETRGQNSWVNFGPHGEANRNASTPDTIFADQKMGLLPDWVVHEGSAQPPP